MYYVYLLKSKKYNKIYIGYSSDLRKRSKRHNSGRVKSTKAYKPWKLIYYEVFNNKRDTRREEIFLKSGKGRERIKYLPKNSI